MGAARLCYIREMLIDWLYERIASTRGTRSLAYLVDMYRLLRSVYLVLHLVRRMNQRFLSLSHHRIVYEFTRNRPSTALPLQ